MKYLGSINDDKDLVTKGDVAIMLDEVFSAEDRLALEKAMSDNLDFLVNPKLEVWGGATSTSNIHVIEPDTDVIFTTNTSGSSHLRLPPNAKNGKRIIVKALQGSTNRTITLYPPNDTDGKVKKLIGYANTSPTTSATTVACSYYTCEFICLISGDTRYWLQISQR